MTAILAINPRKKRKRKKRTTAKKRTTRKAAGGRRKGSTMAKRKTRRRRNPSRVRRYASRAKTSFLGMNVGAALKNQVPLLAGALAAKFMAKRFVDGGGELENWSVKNYAMAGVGALAAGFLAENFKRGSGQKVLEGGMLLIAYKIFQNEIVQPSSTLTEWLGEEEEYEGYGEDLHPDYQGLGGWLGEDLPEDEGYEGYGFGDLYEADDGETYVMGADGQWRPVGETDRMPEEEGYEGYYGETSAPPTSLGWLGESSAPPSNLGAADPYAEAFLGQDGGPTDPYARAFN